MCKAVYLKFTHNSLHPQGNHYDAIVLKKGKQKTDMLNFAELLLFAASISSPMKQNRNESPMKVDVSSQQLFSSQEESSSQVSIDSMSSPEMCRQQQSQVRIDSFPSPEVSPKSVSSVGIGSFSSQEVKEQSSQVRIDSFDSQEVSQVNVGNFDGQLGSQESSQVSVGNFESQVGYSNISNITVKKVTQHIALPAVPRFGGGFKKPQPAHTSCRKILFDKPQDTGSISEALDLSFKSPTPVADRPLDLSKTMPVIQGSSPCKPLDLSQRTHSQPVLVDIGPDEDNQDIYWSSEG